jgi:dolichol-phosphate mannosyltransferase
MNTAPSPTTSRPTLSVVSPVYKAEGIVSELVQRVSEILQQNNINFEIVLIEDSGPDRSWEEIQTIAKSNPLVRAAKLSRNFGQPAATSAGVNLARGDYVVVMDCDLQDDPKYIPELLAKAREGYDIVYTRKRNRSHSAIRNLGARFFNSVFNWLAESPQIQSYEQIGSYSLINRKVADAFNSIKDCHRHYLLILRWLGFKHAFVEVEHAERFSGKSSYTLRTLINYAIDGITSQSTRLLRLSIGLGLLFCCLSLVTASMLVAFYLWIGFQAGWTSLVVINLFSTGVILLSLGTVGIYLGKTFEQSKGRPLYIIGDSVNLES